MGNTYGVSRTFGDTTYSNSGYSSIESALENVYSRAFKAGQWKPPILREKWWQLWRPKEHTDLEKKFTETTDS